MIRVCAAAGLMLILPACGGPHPIPERGPVLRHDHNPEMWIQNAPICTGSPPICIPGAMSYYPETWTVTVRDSVNLKWTGTVDVDENVYRVCDRPKIWPDCWKDTDVI